MKQQSTEFQPDYEREHPGVYLEKLLKARGIKKLDFARRCGRPAKIISEIIKGKVPITAATSLQFERVLGESAEFWMNLNARFQIQKIREKNKAQATEEAKHWVKQFPVSEMVKKGFIPSKPNVEERLEELLKFFGINSMDRFDEYWASRANLARYKQNSHNEARKASVAVWLRQGEISASMISCEKFDKKALRRLLPTLKKLTLSPWEEVAGKLIELCKNVGVAVALVPDLPKTGLLGAAYWATTDKAVIVLSDRNKSEEQIWFAFFHEVAHLLLHGRKSIFLREENMNEFDKEYETEADEFSANFLVSPKEIERFKEIRGSDASTLDENVIKFFAKSAGISPGLFLMRLQREKILAWRTSLNTILKPHVEFNKLTIEDK